MKYSIANFISYYSLSTSYHRFSLGLYFIFVCCNVPEDLSQTQGKITMQKEMLILAKMALEILLIYIRVKTLFLVSRCILSN